MLISIIIRERRCKSPGRIVIKKNHTGIKRVKKEDVNVKETF